MNTKTQVTNKIVWITTALIISLGFFVYSNSLNGEFIWDDAHLVKDNLYIRNWSNIPKFFTQSMAKGADAPTMYSFYRPLQMFTYTLDYSLWKLNVKGYHLTNVILHILASLMLFWLINILYGNHILSFITTILFVSHPIHSEAVSYISGRADPLALTFMLLCFIFYIKSLQKNIKAYCILASVSYVLAILSKEISLVLPLLVFLYHYSFKQRVSLKKILPLFSITLVYAILRFTLLGFLSAHLIHKTQLWQRLPGFFAAIASYFRLMILPVNLHMEYGNELFGLQDPKVLLGIIIFVSLCVLIHKTRLTGSLIFFSSAWFLIALLPSSNLYPINAYMSEHWLYLPSIGCFLLLAKGIAYLYQKLQFKILSLAIVISLVAFYSYLTFAQNSYWSEPISFYQRTLKYAPRSARVYYNLANAFRHNGLNDKAVQYYYKTAEIEPQHADAYYNLGKTFDELNQSKEAMAAYQKASASNPILQLGKYLL